MAVDELWLLRHADAGPHGGAVVDAERPLTERGERQARAAGAALRRLEVAFAAVYASPKVRARDTARLACAALGGPEPVVYEPLSSGFSAADARTLVHGSDGRVLVVGHNPDMAQVVYDLTGARVDFKKGGLAAIRDGELIVLLRPHELARLA